MAKCREGRGGCVMSHISKSEYREEKIITVQDKIGILAGCYELSTVVLLEIKELNNK